MLMLSPSHTRAHSPKFNLMCAGCLYLPGEGWPTTIPTILSLLSLEHGTT
jgi:hypothetical protein